MKAVKQKLNLPTIFLKQRMQLSNVIGHARALFSYSAQFNVKLFQTRNESKMDTALELIPFSLLQNYIIQVWITLFNQLQTIIILSTINDTEILS